MWKTSYFSSGTLTKAIILIRSHICHYREVKLSAIYTKMYDYLMTLKIEDKTKYDAIVTQLPHGSNWISKVIDNIHLLALLRFKPVTQGMRIFVGIETRMFRTTCARYKQTAEGLLEFRRNGHAHLEKDYPMDLLHIEESLVAAIAALQKTQPALPLDQ
ncbi:uncharacterized protein C2845_PM12G30840 [Panicum miliaceum]|uniref:Uncharacterized protein n=1 Tax=Panicum miliaceum TaxID=4540 RepID=A0A3L6QGW3_PANMI|nr:uncharacterized protein C2845_PM12G30840 [Panicum miliaceum]